MKSTKIDLHMHSIFSCDGDFSPEDLVRQAKAAGLTTIAVADHNTTSGVGPALQAGKTAGVQVLPAIELDCLYNGLIFHILGYGINPKDPDLQKIDLDIQCQEKVAAKERIRLVNQAGIYLDEDEALAQAKDGIFVVGELIAEIVLAKPDAAQNPLLQPYLPGGVRSDNPYVNFFWDYCGQDMPAYVPIEYISMEEALRTIHAAGGVAVLAHPGKNLAGREGMLDELAALGVDGVECYSSYHNSETNVFFASRAKKLGLLVTGGSDYHGKTKPSIHMGEYGLEDSGLDILQSLLEKIAASQKKQ